MTSACSDRSEWDESPQGDLEQTQTLSAPIPQAWETRRTRPQAHLDCAGTQTTVSSHPWQYPCCCSHCLIYHNNLNTQCSWCSASCCHRSVDNLSPFFLSGSNAHCHFVSWNITNPLNEHKQTHTNGSIPRHLDFSFCLYIYTTRESNEQSSSGQCIHLLLFSVWKKNLFQESLASAS